VSARGGPSRPVAELRLELSVLGGTLTAIGAGLLGRAATLDVPAREIAPALVQSVVVMIVVALILRRGYGRAAVAAQPLPLGVAVEARGRTIQRSASGAAWATVAALVVDALLEQVVLDGAGDSVPPAVLVGALWLGAGTAALLLSVLVGRWQRRSGHVLLRAVTSRLLFPDLRPTLYTR
jgi:hypothetical protein